jgi:hypothetical protein
MIGTRHNDPLWARALHRRAIERLPGAFGNSALLELVELLARTGQHIALASIRAWSYQGKSDAYFWALAALDGRGEGQAPPWAVRA